MGIQNSVAMLQDYSEVGKLECEIYGKTTIYKEKKQGNKIAFYQIACMADNQEYIYHNLYEQKMKQDELLVKLVYVSSKQEMQYCQEVFLVDCAYEYFQHNILDQMQSRSQTGYYFNEGEFLYIIFSLLQVIQTYKDKQIQNELNLQNILFDSNGHIKVLHNIPKKRHTKKVYDTLINLNHNSQNKTQLLVSPAQLESLYLKKQLPSHNEEKTQLYILGLILLQIGNLQVIDNFFDFHNFNVNIQVVENYVNRLNQLYSQFVNYIIKVLIIPFENQRPSSLELLLYIKEQQKSKGLFINNNITLYNNSYNKLKETSSQILQSQTYSTK